MTLAQEVSDLTASVATDVNTLEDAIGNLASLLTTDKDSLVDAINEIFAGGGSGGVATLDDLTDVVITTPATGHVVRYNGANWVNVLGDTHWQPRDTDLDNLASVANTAYGRAFLALADQAALMGLIPSASTTVEGKVELATSAEHVTGTDAGRAATPAGVAAVFTDRIDTNVALGSSNTKVASQAAVKAYADGLIAANDAMVFKGVLDASTNPNYPASSRGDTYRISVAGKVGGASGPNVEVGDIILALTDGTAAGTHAAVGAQWTIIQSNLDGAVVGPTSSVSGQLASFSGSTGKVIQDSGISIDTDDTMAADSDTRVPTQQAVKAYAASAAAVGNTATDFAAQYAALRA